MEKFGFSAGFIAKIKVLYSEVESVLKVNGSLCAPLRVCRGVRQGCALSGMLYALSLEPLLNKIRLNIEGLILPGFSGSIVLSAYADDREWSDGLLVLPQSLAWRRDGLKYLGVFLGNEAVVKRNWETVIERAEEKMRRWKWLLPQMSYRGRVLVLNNLVGSLLWHRLSCVAY